MDILDRIKADRDYFTQQIAGRKAIVTTYSTITDESAENGAFADNGFEDYTVFEQETAEDDGVLDQAVEYLNDSGITERSSSHFRPGVWYSGEPQIDYGTGETKQYDYHLWNFTPEEERYIWGHIRAV